MTERRLLDAQRRRRQAAIAGHQGDEATARALVGDDDPAVRSAAIGALQRLGALVPADLTLGLGDLDPGVRRRALELVATLRGQGPAADVAIVPLLDDADDTVVEVAAWASGEREPAEPGAVARLAALAREADDALVREAAVAAGRAVGGAEDESRRYSAGDRPRAGSTSGLPPAAPPAAPAAPMLARAYSAGDVLAGGVPAAAPPVDLRRVRSMSMQPAAVAAAMAGAYDASPAAAPPPPLTLAAAGAPSLPSLDSATGPSPMYSRPSTAGSVGSVAAAFGAFGSAFGAGAAAVSTPMYTASEDTEMSGCGAPPPLPVAAKPFGGIMPRPATAGGAVALSRFAAPGM